jgi:pyruvate-ferredoxin/flavodoxin oxidoreductase
MADSDKAVKTLDGNEAVAHIAYHLSEVIAIYPITPSSGMGEWSDTWASAGRTNLWGTVPSVMEMQSEGGAAGALHGAMQTGSLTTTFTASQGLLLMIPNMYKMAGELTPTVFHVTARSLAAQGLSIFGDHQDVMAARQTGFAMLASNSVQEAMDMALIAHASTLETRLPFMHFFDGFRTSHEVAKVEVISKDVMRAMISMEAILAHRSRALTPDRPVMRGTAQNPDVYFQGRETVNPFYAKCPVVVQAKMDLFARLTGRQYHVYEYEGPADAEHVVVMMGSGAEAVGETAQYWNANLDALTGPSAKVGKVGVLKVRLFRPFAADLFVKALPQSVKTLTVLDRTKEPGSMGDPLYLDVTTALFEAFTAGALTALPKILSGRYGLSSKEFTPAMVKAVFQNGFAKPVKNHFTVGIHDDVSHSSLDFDPQFSIEPKDVVRAVFYGLGADGTVGANKNSIKIIGENTANYAQGYFVYDSKKSGSSTISHLRFGPRPIRSTYQITSPNFVACHQPVFLERFDMVGSLAEGGVFLLNSPQPRDKVWDSLPRVVQEKLIEKKAQFYSIDAVQVARESGMGSRINTVMQVCFFAISGVLPKDEAITAIKESIRKSYARKGDEVVQKNIQAVDQALNHMHVIDIPTGATSVLEWPPIVSHKAPTFTREVQAKMMAGLGHELPVSAMPVDGTYPTGTAAWEKRNIAWEIPVWDPNACIQCNKCALFCPHAAIRVKAYEPAVLEDALPSFKSIDAKEKDWKGLKYTVQVAPEDCTGCGICVDICPGRNKQETRLRAINMAPQAPLRAQEAANWDYFLSIPEKDRLTIKADSIRQQQVQQPLFEFSGACSGCGETPYLKLATQLFGDRMLIANATGCSSIYGGNLPTTPYSKNAEGRGPAWSNSLFEDNAEFGLGYRLSLDKQSAFARELLPKVSAIVGDNLVDALLNGDQSDEAGIVAQRERVAVLKTKLQEAQAKSITETVTLLLSVADYLVRKSVWIVGGDGWAYDIGFGGLDHVFASGRNVNILVLDTEVYSNTGGQMSKSTPRSAVAKFAEGGKQQGKKDLGLIAMSYGNVYVARVAMGAKDEHTLKAFIEAEKHPGVSLIIAYSHCIAHGIDMRTANQNQRMAVATGQWLLYRYNPALANDGKNPFLLDSKAPTKKVKEFLDMENRFKMLAMAQPDVTKQLHAEAQTDVDKRWKYYEAMAAPAVATATASTLAAPTIAPTATGENHAA